MSRSRIWRWALVAFALGLIIVSFLSAYAGYFSQNPSPLEFLQTWFVGIGPEAAGIAVTIIVIDYLNEKREEERQKYEAEQQELHQRKALHDQLLREIGSSDNGLAMRAWRELNARELLQENSLVGIFLNRANLSHSSFSDRDMKESSLYDATFQYAEFYRTDLSKANGMHADFEQAKFTAAKLIEAWLSHCNFKGASFEKADLSRATLVSSDFSNVRSGFAIFTKADVSSSNFNNATLHDVNFNEASVYETDFSGADLRGTNFRGVNGIRDAIFQGAKYNHETEWPEDFDIESAGLVLWDPSLA